MYRWAWHPPEPVTPAEQARRVAHCRAVADAYWAAHGRPAQVGGRVDDGHSWREGVGRAMADDSGVDADNW